jgi:hypothetical protein
MVKLRRETGSSVLFSPHKTPAACSPLSSLYATRFMEAILLPPSLGSVAYYQVTISTLKEVFLVLKPSSTRTYGWTGDYDRIRTRRSRHLLSSRLLFISFLQECLPEREEAKQ